MRYRRIAVVKLDEQWEWKGVLHEVLIAPRYPQAQYLPGLRIRVFTDGARSQQSQQEKFGKDAEVLRNALEKEPDNARYAFYLAQSLRDALRLPEAIEAYERRIAMGGWFEEVYYSKLQLGRLKEQIGATYAEVAAAYLDAYDFRPSRADAACEAARFFRLRERWNLAVKFSEIASNLQPNDDMLFVDSAAYAWRARDEWSISAYWSGDFTLSARLCRELLAGSALPDHERARVQKNLEFAEAKL
jgi:tetratricopeptide (TPR) repeat protein